MEKADEALQEGKAVYNVDMFTWYRDGLVIALYVLPAIASLLCIIGIKYRTISRIFFYFEMINFFLQVMISKIPATPWDSTFQISTSLLVGISFSVDIKSNVLALLIIHPICDIMRTNLEQWEVTTGYVI